MSQGDIVRILSEAKRPLSSAEIVEKSGRSYSVIRTALALLVRHGEVQYIIQPEAPCSWRRRLFFLVDSSQSSSSSFINPEEERHRYQRSLISQYLAHSSHPLALCELIEISGLSTWAVQSSLAWLYQKGYIDYRMSGERRFYFAAPKPSHLIASAVDVVGSILSNAKTSPSASSAGGEAARISQPSPLPSDSI